MTVRRFWACCLVSVVLISSIYVCFVCLNNHAHQLSNPASPHHNPARTQRLAALSSQSFHTKLLIALGLVDCAANSKVVGKHTSTPAAARFETAVKMAMEAMHPGDAMQHQDQMGGMEEMGGPAPLSVLQVCHRCSLQLLPCTHPCSGWSLMHASLQTLLHQQSPHVHLCCCCCRPRVCLKLTSRS